MTDPKLINIQDGQAIFDEGSTLPVPEGVDPRFRPEFVILDTHLPDRWHLAYQGDSENSPRGLVVQRGFSMDAVKRAFDWLATGVAKRKQQT
jgi:hypothetical protein